MRMKTKTFHSLRYFAQIILPTLATFLITVCEAWGFDFGVNVGITISGTITLLSGIMGASSAIYDKERGADDGEGMGADNSFDTDYLHQHVHVSNRSGRPQAEEEEQCG